MRVMWHIDFSATRVTIPTDLMVHMTGMLQVVTGEGAARRLVTMIGNVAWNSYSIIKHTHFVGAREWVK